MVPRAPRPGQGPDISAREAAALIGVKLETLYAYVSRGMLERRRSEDGRSSRFLRSDVERFAQSRRRGPQRAAPVVVVDTRLTSIEGHRLLYRGYDAVELAQRRSFEWVAELLWLGEAPSEATAWSPSVNSAELIAREVAGLPPTATHGDRLRVAAAVAGATHSLRHDLRPEAVARSGRRLIATMVEALTLRRQGVVPELEVVPGELTRGSIASRLWPRLGAGEATPSLLRALNAALVLLADHELAASTLAARVAASTRADPYAVVGSGLGVLSGSLHGTASVPVQRLLAEAGEVGGASHAEATVADHLRHASHVPGFGHPLYPEGDPRAAALIALVRSSDASPQRLETVEAVHELVSNEAGIDANVDFGIAALAHVAGFDLGAGEAIFAVARSAGWIAHAIEEYAERPNRYRVRARYSGPESEPMA